jgi:hypothetical protein
MAMHRSSYLVHHGLAERDDAGMGNEGMGMFQLHAMEFLSSSHHVGSFTFRELLAKNKGIPSSPKSSLASKKLVSATFLYYLLLSTYFLYIMQ